MRKSARQRERHESREEALQHLQRARRANARSLVEKEEDEVEWDPNEDLESSTSEDDDTSSNNSRSKALPPRSTRKRPLDATDEALEDGITTRSLRKREPETKTINPKDPRLRRRQLTEEEPPQNKNPRDPRQRRTLPPRSSPEPEATPDSDVKDVKVVLPTYTDSSDEDEELNLLQVQKPAAPVVKSILKRPPPKSEPEPSNDKAPESVGKGWAGMIAKAQNKPVTVHKRPSRQRQVLNMRPAMNSTSALSQFYEDIMDWDFGASFYNDLHNKFGNSSEANLQVPSKFESYEHYFEVWKPLAVQEVQAQSISGVTTDMPASVPVIAAANMLTFGVSTLKVSIAIDRKANPTKKHYHLLDDFRKDDLVLLTSDSSYLTRRMKKNSEGLDTSVGILAIVDTQKSTREGLVLIVTVKKWKEIKTDGPLFLLKISNLITSFREYRALCQCRDYKLMPLLLSGESQSATTKLDSLGMAYVQWLRRTFNESQQEAITAAATSQGFTLIKGPPGTGKTTTLKGLLNSLHLREYNRYYNAVLDVARRPDHETSRAWAAIGDEKPHILVAAPSNIAVDNIIAKIIEEGFCDGEGRQYFPNIIRVGRGANLNVKSVVLEVMVEAICSQPLEVIEMRCRQLHHELAMVQNDAVLLRNEFRGIIKWIEDLVEDAKKNPPQQVEVEQPPEDVPPPIIDHGTSSLDFDQPAENAAAPTFAVYRSDSEDESANVPFSCEDAPNQNHYHSMLEDEVDEPLPKIENGIDEDPIPEEEQEIDEPLPIKVVSNGKMADAMEDDAPPPPPPLEDGECSDSEPPPPPPPPADEPDLPPEPPSPPAPKPNTLPPPPQEPVVIDYNAYKPYKDMAQRINLCLERFHTLKLELQRYSMVKRSLEAHGRVVKETQDQLESSFLESAHIVFTTLSSAGHRALDDSTRYDILVIDEAAQAVELSTIIPMRFGSRQCVLVGDPQQLSATTFSRTSAQSLYERSLFERLESCGHPVHMLRTQYRSHPIISAFPRQYFYGGLLQDGDNVRQPAYHKMYHALAPAFKPLVFWNLVHSREGMSSMSRSNIMETKLAVNLYLTLRNSCPPDSIRGKVGVITPYAAQMEELKRAFTAACQGDFNQDVEINTVDGYQGREKDIIILSTVRSDPRKGVGFLNDIRRMNVALTRAKFACYVIGSEAALQNSTPWAALLDHARMTGCMVNVQDPQENLFQLTPLPPGQLRQAFPTNRSPRNRSPRSPPYHRRFGGRHMRGRGRGPPVHRPH